MKSFTKFYVLMLAMLMSFGLVAQQMSPLEYQVKQAQDQATLKAHGPTVVLPMAPAGGRAVGDDCSDPIIVTLPAALPYADMGNTTCGRGNTYSNSCMNSYDGGEDVTYQIVVTTPVWVEFTFDPVDTWGGFAIMDACGDAGTCLYLNTGSGNTARVFKYNFTTAGTYYIMIDTWPSPNCTGYDLMMVEYTPPPPPTPIASFPALFDFNSCSVPAQFQLAGNDQAHAVINTNGMNSTCGIMMDGNSSTGWAYSSDPAVNWNSPGHQATAWSTVTPSGQPGLLTLLFDFRMNFSFGTAYNVFALTVDGMPIADKNGIIYHQAVTASSDPWVPLEYNLAAYQNNPDVQVRMVNSGNYYYLYYQGGDATFIDNVQYFYKTVGTVEGYCTVEFGAPAAGAEVGFLGDDPVYPPVMADGAGYYRFDLVPTAPSNVYEMYAFLDGQNYVEQTATLVTGDVVEVDFNLSAPLMVISPVVLEETMNPNEWRSVPISIVNGGSGALHWTAAIEFGPAPPAMSRVSTPINQEVVPLIDGRSYFSQGETPKWPAQQYDMNRADNSRDGLDVAWITSTLPASNDFSQMTTALLALGINSCTPVAMQPLTTTVDDLLAYDALIFSLNTFFTVPTGPVGDLLADYVDAGGKLIITSPINAAGWPNLPVGGRLLNEGYYPTTTTGSADFNTTTMVVNEPDSPLLEGVASVSGSLTVICNIAPDAELVASWSNGSVLAAIKGSVISVNGFFAATGYWSGDMDVLLYNAINYLQGGGGGGWLDMSAYEGDVPANGGSGFVNALFDASGTVAGQVWTATINFTAEPAVSTTPVAVSMIIAGEPLMPVEDFTAELVNMVTGAVQLSWSAPANTITFEYYLIRRNGQPIANTTNLSYIDILPTYGVYNYTLSAVYAEGESVPAGPEEVIWLIPVPCFTPDILGGAQLEGYVWTGTSETVTMTIENCGEGMLAFDFTDFNDPTHSEGFVKAVHPYAGQIAEGESMDVTFTFSAVGVAPGTYTVDVPMTTNALAPLNEIDVPCYMIAYEPAIIQGHVEDCNSGLPLANVNVLASSIIGDFTAMTDASGNYMMYVEAYFDPWGAYYVAFTKLGYEDQFVFGVNTQVGTPTIVDAVMCETPYPVNWVVADPNEADTQCMVTWSLPMGPYEISYDDGEADNYFAWVQFGGAVSVKFTPAGYPATVVGGRLYVGDGSYPVGGNFIGMPMAVGVLAADGPSGFPGTVIDSMVVTVDQYGWITFGGFNYTIESGNFYLAMWQLTTPPNSPPIGIDTDVPTMYRSYTKQAGQDWKVSTYQDFMYRAVVFGPGDNVMMAPEGAMVYPPKPVDATFITLSPYNGRPGTEKMGDYTPIADMAAADRDLMDYSIAFVDNFDPNAGETPRDGQLNILSNDVTDNSYNYTGWGSKPAGFYAFAVKANYESSESVWAYSNVAAHLLDNVATFTVTLCDGMEPSGASLTLQGLNYPYQHLTGTTDATGVIVFDSVIDGRYNLVVNKFGYQSYIYNDIYILEDYSLDVVLEQVTFPPRNLYVDPLTSIATWDEPIYVQVPLQDFEGTLFPPAGWSRTSTGAQWFRTDNGSSASWTIPSGDGFYAAYNDDANSGNIGCCAYLITPELNLTATATYKMYFRSFYNGMWGGSAYVEYSTDGGASWEEFSQLSAGSAWEDLTIDLASISGQNGLSNVWFAFHYDDNGSWADGWAVDNVAVSNGAVETVQGYQVFLDGGYVAATAADVRTYQYNDLQYGVQYTAAVAALYCTLSEKVYYTWTSGYLYPPRNLDDAYVYNTNEVPLMWNPPMTGNGVPMATAPSTNYVKGNGAPNAGAIPLNGVAVAAGETPNPLMFNGFRAPTVYGVDNSNSTYSSFDGEAPGTLTVLGPWPGGGAFANAAEIVTGSNGEAMYEVDNTGAARFVNLTDGSSTALGNIGVLANAMALDYQTGIYYATDGNSLFTLDFDAITSTNVGSLGAAAGNLMIGMTFDEDGNLYMYDLVVDMLWSCDKETGACTQIGSIGFDANYGQGMAWDQALGVPVMSAFNSGAFACEYRTVDVTTGMSTFVGNIGSPGSTQMGTICIPVVGGGGGGAIPPGLMSFNVYRDGGFVANVPYNGEKTDEFVYYVENPVNPGTYLYDVTAVYDLGAYGFPGESGESMTEGPDTVKVVWGFDIPFMETWSQGTFGFNSWTTASSNWKINSQIGNPEPSAEFTWDPAPSGLDYALSLTSAPLNADMMTEGKIFLEYEVKLNDRNMTGLENLVVEVYNGQDWNQVASYSNNGSFDWTFNKLDITQYAMSRVFQVRFTATGVNSFDIISWFVDNIYIYRMCDTPTKLEGMEYDLSDENGAKLKWEAPELPVPPQGWIHWDSGTSFTGIGVGDPVAWDAAARWAANTFPEYAGTSVTKVSVFAYDAGFTSWVVKIWSGANGSILLYSQDVTSQMNVGAWTTITLTTPVPYDVTKELWVGYTVTQTQDAFPASVDAGPAVAGFGDKVRLDGTTWENLSDYGLSYNNNIQAYVEVVTAAPVSTIVPLTDNTVYSEKALALKQGPVSEEGVTIDHSNSTRSFTNFNVYKMDANGQYALLAEVPWVEGQSSYEYLDDVTVTPATYCYKVTAVWESATDYCESAPAPAKFSPMDDYVCVLVTDVNDPNAEGVFSLYPNPANDRVNISSSQAMKDITVYNYVGQVVFRSDLGKTTTTTLNTGSYEAGVYVVRINTENGVVTRRVTITR